MMTYPKGLIKSTVHAAAISVHLFAGISKMILLGIKKSLRLEAIGETDALPDSLLSSVKRWQKYEEYLEPPKKNGEILK